MSLRPRSGARAATIATLLVVALTASIAAVTTERDRPAAAAPGGSSEVIALLVEGVGHGHGRGLSQWGAYGRAVDGQSYGAILDAYYGGTSASTANSSDHQPAANGRITVRLVGHDGASDVGVVSAGGTARWNGNGSYRSLHAEHLGGGNYRVWGSSSTGCPGDDIGWTELTDSVAGPVVFSTTVDETNAGGGSVLGLCRSDRSVTHYRGEIRVLRDGNGSARVVNDVDIENYLRGVLPREVFASWGSAAGGAGMNALRAQAVAARSYALSQNRYVSAGAYAKTCDTTACQAYGGSAHRSSPTAGATSREHSNTDIAVSQTTGEVRRWSNGSVVSTEYSASNGPRTAGGAFPAVDDPFDDTAGNRNHRWTRVIPASAVSSRYGIGALSEATTRTSSSRVAAGFEGIWANEVRLVGEDGERVIGAWDFRSHFGLLSPGFRIRPVTREMLSAQSFAFIGDSVGESITQGSTAPLPTLLDGVFADDRFDARSGRRTVGGTVQPNGLAAASAVPRGTDLVMVQLGYNDVTTSGIDVMVEALRDREVGTIVWVNLSERRGDSFFSEFNTALSEARARHPELVVLDWNDVSSGADRDRWFTDDVHLSATGRAEFAVFLRDQLLALIGGGPIRAPQAVIDQKVDPNVPAHAMIAGRAGVPDDGSAVAVALNVTAVDPDGPGYLTVWPCGAERPEASNVNYLSSGAVEPNAVLVQLDETGEVCIYSYASAHVLVDVAGWFSGGFQGIVPDRVVDTRSGEGAPAGRVSPSDPLEVRFESLGVPDDAVAVALNVTAVDPVGPGYLTVWPCGAERPEVSNVNYLSSGAVEPNAVLVQLDETGEVCIYTYAAAQILVDVAGWFTGGFEPIVPERVIDTRSGLGASAGKVSPSDPLAVPIAGAAGVPDDGSAVAVALNVTAVDPDGPGYLTVWPCGAERPEVSNVNYLSSGAVEPNAVLVQLDETGEVCIYTYAAAQILVDVAGWFSGGFEGIVPDRVLDTRSGLGR